MMFVEPTDTTANLSTIVPEAFRIHLIREKHSILPEIRRYKFGLLCSRVKTAATEFKIQRFRQTEGKSRIMG
jgi:hypothetical protein